VGLRSLGLVGLGAGLWDRNSVLNVALALNRCIASTHVVCLSICPSVTLVDCDHIGWNFFEIISPLVSLGCSLSADANIREHQEILAQSDPLSVDLSVRDIRSQIATEWLQIAQRSQWRAYRKPPSLFRTAPSLTPYVPTTSPFPQNGGSL